MKRDDPEMESGSRNPEAGRLGAAAEAQQNTQRAEDAARLLARENSLVAEIGRTISSSLEIDEVYERFGKQVSELVPFDRIDIVTVDRDRDTMRVEYTFGIDVPASTSRRGYTRPLAGSVVDAIVRRQSGVRLVAGNKDEVTRQFPPGLPTYELGFRSAIWAPLTARGEPIGMLALMWSRPDSYTERHLELAEQVAAQIAGAIASARLYADLKRADQVLRESQAQLVQAEKMSALGTLTAGIAHELNNPLMGILNLAQYCIRHTDKEDKLYQVVKDIERETQRSIGVVQELLTFSRFEQQQAEGFQLDSLATVLDRALSLLSYRIAPEGVSVATQIAEKTPPVFMNVNNMQLVFLNVLINALDALSESHEGAKEVEVDIRAERERVQVMFADNGLGIEPHHLAKIFDPFFTTKPAGKGTGLGLAVSRSIIHATGGEISCESERGAGTRFTISLPVGREANQRP